MAEWRRIRLITVSVVPQPQFPVRWRVRAAPVGVSVGVVARTVPGALAVSNAAASTVSPVSSKSASRSKVPQAQAYG